MLLCIAFSLALTAIYLLFQESILTLFGEQINDETFRQAKEYFFWITSGICQGPVFITAVSAKEAESFPKLPTSLLLH